MPNALWKPRMYRLLSGALFALAVLVPGAGYAQPSDTRYAEEPTAGLGLPLSPLAGEYSAFSTVVNPAGVSFLRGPHAGLAATLDDDDRDGFTYPGRGLGLYAATSLGASPMARYGLGVGVDFLRPPRSVLSPDPGTPARLSVAGSLPLRGWAALGVSWHRFFDDPGFLTSGLSTWNLGLAMRLGAHLAAGATIRDASAPTVGGLPVQRRYEAELLLRPLGDDRLELTAGGRVGEIRTETDGWLRLSARLFRGVYLRGEVATTERIALAQTPAGTAEDRRRELSVTAGLEVSFGSFGVSMSGAMVRAGEENRLGSGTVMVRASTEHIPSVLGPTERIERIELRGAIGQRQLTALVVGLRAIARDPAVRAVLVQIADLSAGWATLQEIRGELWRLREAGKPVYAYLVVASTAEYFVASAANTILIDPAGGIRLQGLAATVLYYKGFFDKLGVSAQFEKIEEFKSAPEAWTNTAPTEPALRMRNSIYDSIYSELITAIATARGIDRRTVQSLVDAGPYTAGDLKNSPLVDHVVTAEEAGKIILGAVGNYPVARAPAERQPRWSAPKIAVIYIDGDIIDGKSQTLPFIGRKLVGSETIVQALVRARLDPSIKAIVLRIDSPGGSALASELMAREVFKTRGVKPIICSMGELAASGGYFAAAGCETVFAEPMTITGSIGIFYGKFETSGLIERLGLTTHTYKRGNNADMESLFRPYTNEERALIKDKIRYLYDRFISTVAEGRQLTKERVNEIGRGRVWSGAQAKGIKLVDELGGIGDAIALAKQRVGLSEDTRVRLVLLPEEPQGLLARLTGIPGLRSQEPRDDVAGLLGMLPSVKELVDALPASLWVQPETAQARLPFAIFWHH